jgi:hypothetical protein
VGLRSNLLIPLHPREEFHGQLCVVHSVSMAQATAEAGQAPRWRTGR